MSKPTDIELTVGLSVEDIGNTTKTLQDMIKDIFDESAGQELDLSLQRIKERMAAVTAEAMKVIEKMTELENTQIPTEEYSAIQDHLHTVEEAYQKLLLSQERLREQGITDGPTWDRVQSDLERFKSLIEEDKQRLQELVNTGKAFTLGSDTDEYKQLAEKLALINNKTRLLINSWEQQRNSTAENSKQVDKFNSSMKKSTSRMKEFSRASKNARSALGGFGAGIASTTGVIKKGIKMLLKYALGIGSMVVLIRKFKEAAKEGIKNIVLWEGENGKLNQSISSILSAISTLKNNIGAMVSPLINALAPAITKVINLLNEAITKISMFVALLSGQKTILVADQVQENYAKSLDKTAKSAKNAEKALKGYLSPIDEINKYQSNADDGGAGGAAGATFHEMPIDSEILEWVEKLKKLLEMIKNKILELKKYWDAFKNGFLAGLGDWKNRLLNIWQNLQRIKAALKEIFTDPRVMQSADEFATALFRFLGTLAGAIVSMGITIVQNLVGGIAKYLEENKERIKNHLISMFNVWAHILNQLSDFLEAFAEVFEVFGDENGQRVTAALIGIFADAFMGISELVSKAIDDIITLITQPFIDNKEDIKEAVDGSLGVIADVLETVKQAVDDLVDTLNEAYDEYIHPFIEDLTEDVSEMLAQFLDWYNNKALPIIQGIADEVKKAYEQYIKPTIEKLKPLIGKVVDLVRLVWENWLKPLMQWIQEKIYPIVLWVLTAVKNSVSTAFKFIGEQIGYIMDVIGGIIDFIVGVFTGDWKRAWYGVAEIFVGIFNSIISAAEWAVNTIVDLINSISFDVPDWLPDWMGAGNHFSFNIPKVQFKRLQYKMPNLAQGAVIPPNREFMAVLGDQKSGTNIETPLSTMVDAFNQALQQNGGAGQSITLNLMLPDKRTIAQYAIEGGQVLQMSRGRNPFLLERG